MTTKIKTNECNITYNDFWRPSSLHITLGPFCFNAYAAEQSHNLIEYNDRVLECEINVCSSNGHILYAIIFISSKLYSTHTYCALLHINELSIVTEWAAK